MTSTRDKFIVFNLLLLVFMTVVYMYIGSNHFTNEMDITNALYFAIVTQTTVGYGDILPTTKLSKVIVSLHILISIYYNLFELINPEITRWPIGNL